MTMTRKQKRKQETKPRIIRNPLCGLLKPDLRKQGIEVQTWGGGPNGECIYAGVHWVPEISARWLYRLHTHWLKWRKWYDNLPENRDRSYPARLMPQVCFTGAHPIDDPKQTRWLTLIQ